MQETMLPIAEIDSEADFVIYSPDGEVLSEHCTEGEARMACYKEMARQTLGSRVPIILERQEQNWVHVK